MEQAAVVFAICIPLAALIFGAVSIRNLDVRTMNENLRSEVTRLEGELGQRDLHIISLDVKYRACEEHRDEDRRDRLALLERLLRIERQINGGVT
jgi:hypothetical protein